MSPRTNIQSNSEGAIPTCFIFWSTVTATLPCQNSLCEINTHFPLSPQSFEIFLLTGAEIPALPCDLMTQQYLCPSDKRKSVIPQDLNKGNKRLSCAIKPTEGQTKRGKVRSFSLCFLELLSYTTIPYSPFLFSLEMLLNQTRSSLTWSETSERH